MPLFQDLLHGAQGGRTMRYVRVGVALMAVLVIVGAYNWRGFRNMGTQEAMDAAQLARNIAQGKGYTTLFIRPFSIHLVKERNKEKYGAPAAGKTADLAQLQGMHPDIANPPLYPVVLAGLLRVLPLDYAASATKPFWSKDRHFWRYEPDFVIALFNELLFLGAASLVFLLARRLFDPAVAWVAFGVMLGTELFWRFSVSGLSTMLLLLIFTGLAWALVLLDEEVRAPKRGPWKLVALGGLCGLMVGLGGLTRYAFAWLIIPVLVFLVLFGGRQRVVLALSALAVFAALMAPWIARNYDVSGKPFGTATYTVVETTLLYPENRLLRSLEPDFNRLYTTAFWLKLNTNARQILTSELPRLGGSWVTAFFLVGLLVGFRNPSISRLRYFLLGCVLVLGIAQALGRTQLSEQSPEINSENLLVLLTPLVLVYGVSLFFLLLEQMPLAFPEMRYLVIGVFSVVACLPMLFVFLPPRISPVSYPPYHPQAVQTVSGWLKEDELAMSDIPWAVAWYGQRQCVWLTLKCTSDPKDPTSHEDFFTIYDWEKPIVLLYLTPETMDSRFLSQWVRAGDLNWGSFIFECVVRRKVPGDFPLSKSQAGWLPEQLVLTDSARWDTAR